MSVAETWDSYKPTLMLVLNSLIPVRCFEWGSGMSTKTTSEHPAVQSLDSVEHNGEWYDKAKYACCEKVNLIYEPNCELYYLAQGRYDKYDFIFIDGIMRDKCLVKAKDILADNGVVMLHDAERMEYQPLIETYKYRFWRDCGHTVVLTDNNETSDILNTVFSGLANV